MTGTAYGQQDTGRPHSTVMTPTACDLMCLASELESLKRLLQMEHENGFSPVWVRVWTVRALIWMNRFGQLLHPKGLCGGNDRGTQ